MATVDPTIALSAKAPDAMTGLGQMLNIARGAQAYQQQAESFPTLLEQQKLALNRSQQMLPIEVRQAEATAGTSELGLNQKQLTIAGGMLTGLEYSDALKSGNIPELTSQVKTIQNVLTANKIPVEKTFGQINELLAKGDVQGVQNFIANLRTGLASTEQKFSAALPQFTEVGGQPATTTQGGPRGGTIQNAPISNVEPPAPAQPAPITTGGTTSFPVAAPPKTVARPAPFVIGNVDINQPEAPKYPVRVSGKVTAPATTEETAAQTAGNAYYTGLSMEQPKLARQVDNLRNVVTQATKLQGTMLGAGKKSENEWAQLGNDALRKVYTNVAVKLGSTELQEMAKDLANAQQSIVAAGGARTDAGLDLAKVATGTEKTSPEVLIKIAQRTMAEVKNIDSQAEAARKFKDKFGTNNMEAFQRMWGKNADTRVFQIMNVVDSVKDPKEQKALLGQIYGGDTKELAAGLQKYRNIKKLMADGTL